MKNHNTTHREYGKTILNQQLDQMKAHISLIILLFSIASYTWAQSTQPCVVLQYNQKKPKTPLAGVEVMASNAGSKVSSKDGTLTLSFCTLKPGDKVNLISAQKAGYEVFNTEAVEQWIISSTNKPFSLVLVDREYFSQLKKSLKQSSTTNYRKKYEQTMTELKKSRDEGRLKEQEYYKKINELEDHYDNQLRNLDTYVDQFARFDLSELTEQERTFIELAHAGLLDEAVAAYNHLDLANKYSSTIENIRQLNESINKIDNTIIKQQAIADRVYTMLQRQVATLKLAGGEDNYRKAGELLKRAALADTTNLKAIMAYAKFSLEQNDLYEAERFYQICLNGCADDYLLRIDAMNHLGQIYDKNNDNDKAKKIFFDAFSIVNLLYNNNPQNHLYDIIHSYNLLGLAYSSEKYLVKALELIQTDSNKTGELSTLINLSAVCYLNSFNATSDNHKKKYIQDALTYSTQALEKVKLLYDKDSDFYNEYVLNTKNNLANILKEMKEYDSAEYYYLQILNEREELFKKNPDAFRPSLASAYLNLALLYRYMNDPSKFEKNTIKAFNHYSILFLNNPNAYHKEYSKLLWFFHVLYSFKGDEFSSHRYLYKDLCTYVKLAKLTPQKYNQEIKTRERQNMCIYVDDSNEKYYLCELDKFYRQLDSSVDNNTEKKELNYDCDIFTIERGLGYYYSYGLNDKDKAECFYKNTFNFHFNLYRQNPSKYYGNLSKCFNSLLTCFYKDNQDSTHTKFKQFNLELYNRMSLLLEQDPKYRSGFSFALYEYVMSEDSSQACNFLFNELNHYSNISNQEVNSGCIKLEILKCLSRFYRTFNNEMKYHEFLMKSHDESARLFKSNPERFWEQYIEIIHTLESIYYDKKNYNLLREICDEIYDAIFLLYSINPNQYSELFYKELNTVIWYYEDIKKDYPATVKYLLKEIEVLSFLAKKNPKKFLNDLFSDYKKIGDLYRERMNDNNKAWYYYNKTWERYTEAVNEDNTIVSYITGLFLENEYMNLRGYYKNRNSLSNIEKNYKIVLEQEIELRNQNNYNEKHLFKWQQELYNFYINDMNDYSKAESLLLKMSDTYIQLMQHPFNYNKYEKALKSTENSTYFFYVNIKHDIRKAEKYLFHQLELHQKLFKDNPKAHYNSLEIIMKLIVYFYNKNGKSSKAESFYKKQLSNHFKLFKKDPEKYYESLINMVKLAANNYSLKENTSQEEAQNLEKLFYIDQFENNKKPFQNNPQKYRPFLSDIMFKIGDYLYNLKEYTLAEHYYQNAKEQYEILYAETDSNKYIEKVAYICYHLMYIYNKNDNRIDDYNKMLTDALKYYEQLYIRNEKFESMLIYLRITKGLIFLRKGEIDEAITLFQSTYLLSPDKSASYLTSSYNAKAYECAKKNDFLNAIRFIDKTFAIQPLEANFYDSKGEILLMMGDNNGAIQLWEKVLKLDPNFLNKHNGSTPLYKQLKEKGLIE